jgi:hypothetical protein
VTKNASHSRAPAYSLLAAIKRPRLSAESRNHLDASGGSHRWTIATDEPIAIREELGGEHSSGRMGRLDGHATRHLPQPYLVLAAPVGDMGNEFAIGG